MHRPVRRRISRLRPRDVVEAFAVLAIATRIEISLRRRGLPSTAARFGVRLAKPLAAAEPPMPRERLPAWAVRRARLVQIFMRRWPLGDTCLRKSLVIGNRLAALSPELFIGVRAAERDGSVAAHAWLRIRGIDIDPTSADYLAFDLT
jgi:hypothetical protein